MKTIFYTAGLGLLLTACSGESTSSTSGQDSIPADSAIVVVPNIVIDVDALLAKYTFQSEMPYLQDSTYLAHIVSLENSAITAQEAEYLSYNFIESDLSYSGKSAIDDVLFFDSLKTNGAYEEYLQVLDLGMMKDANAFVAEIVRLDDSTDLLLWYVDFGTYEACPYFAGQNLYASVFRNKEVKSCTLVGENSGGGDAPFWSETVTLFSADNGKMQCVKTDRNGGDTDEEGNELMSEGTAIYSLEIVNGTWQVTEQTEAAQ